jgi:hypothetical protein
MDAKVKELALISLLACLGLVLAWRFEGEYFAVLCGCRSLCGSCGDETIAVTSPIALTVVPDPAKFPAHQDEGIRSHQPAIPRQGGSLHGDVVGHDKLADCLTSLMPT